MSKRKRKLSPEKKEAIHRKEMQLHSGYNGTDVTEDGKPWWESPSMRGKSIIGDYNVPRKPEKS